MVKRGARGMTLAEMMIGVFIASIIMVVLWDLFGSGSKAAAYGTWYSSRVQELRTCLRMVREDLAKATYASVIKPGSITVSDTAADHYVGQHPGQSTLPSNFDAIQFHICRPDRTNMPENIQPADILCTLSAVNSTIHYKRSAVSGDVKPEDTIDKDLVRDCDWIKLTLTPQVTGDADGSQATGDSTGTLTIQIHCTYPFDSKKGCDEVTTAKLNIKYKTI